MEDYEKETAIKNFFVCFLCRANTMLLHQYKGITRGQCHTGAHVLIIRFLYATSKTRKHWAPVWPDPTLNSILLDWTNSKVHVLLRSPALNSFTHLTTQNLRQHHLCCYVQSVSLLFTCSLHWSGACRLKQEMHFNPHPTKPPAFLLSSNPFSLPREISSQSKLFTSDFL